MAGDHRLSQHRAHCESLGAGDQSDRRAGTPTINASDPDGDNVTYTVTGEPGKGSVIVNADGAFTYTPTNAARHNAAAATATEIDKQDTFTVALDDGHGGVVYIFPEVGVAV